MSTPDRTAEILDVEKQLKDFEKLLDNSISENVQSNDWAHYLATKYTNRTDSNCDNVFNDVVIYCTVNH